nr:DUF423 domain-containing protein [Lysinibacillus timonensis]
MKGSIISGAIHGFLVVALGAFGAHGLKAILDDYSIDIWNTAVQYQMFHATAILIIGVLMSTKVFGNVPTLKWASIFMNFGIVFFAGSLYVLALTGIKVLGAITPIGGVLFLIGWVLTIVTVIKHAK